MIKNNLSTETKCKAESHLQREQREVAASDALEFLRLNLDDEKVQNAITQLADSLRAFISNEAELMAVATDRLGARNLESLEQNGFSLRMDSLGRLVLFDEQFKTDNPIDALSRLKRSSCELFSSTLIVLSEYNKAYSLAARLIN